MLEDVTIKDFALISSASLELQQGFTVLSGETGAGKSILIGALSFLLGGKAGIEQIRVGCNEAKVFGTVLLNEAQIEARDWLSEHGIEPENDRVLLRRNIKDNGKSQAFIQDTPVTRNELAEFTSFFFDIHGQHEHQSLMKVPEHRKLLDLYAGIQDEVAEFTRLYSKLVEKRTVLQQMNTSDEERERKIEMYSFAIDEIAKAKLKPNEDVDLANEETKLSQYEKLFSDIEQLNNCLSEDSSSVVPVLKKLRSVSDHAANLDKALVSVSERINNAFYEVSDIAEEIKSYSSSLAFDSNRLEEIQDRSALIYNLKQKYAASTQSPIEDVIKYAEDAQIQLDTLKKWQGNKESLLKEISVIEKEVLTRARLISNKRKSAAVQMQSKVKEILAHLGMPNAEFSVLIVEKESDSIIQKCGPYGFDNIEFLISANKGITVQPLAKIASGGELSRVMLALKTILASNDTINTLIFDEIDTGIGGEVATAVGKHLKLLSEKKQILCITHLASIAVYADTQIRIEKEFGTETTQTNIKVVQGQERVEEIARMLAGDAFNEASLEHARSLLKNGGNPIG